MLSTAQCKKYLMAESRATGILRFSWVDVSKEHVITSNSSTFSSIFYPGKTESRVNWSILIVAERPRSVSTKWPYETSGLVVLMIAGRSGSA